MHVFHMVLPMMMWSWSAFAFSSLLCGVRTGPQIRTEHQHVNVGRRNEEGLVSSSRLFSEEVSVYDGTFSASTCAELHHLAVEHCIRGDDGSSLFTRPPHNERPLTPLEHAIHSALLALGDTTRKVEYWSRDEYMNIDVHADIDELQLEEQEEDNGSSCSDHPPTIRCPQMGHVLYLMVDQQLRGPTCVFPTKRTGWNLATESAKTKDQRSRVELVTVPAVQGRILRFPGSAMHSVPKPTHRWFMSREDQQALQTEEDGDVLDDDDDSYSTAYEYNYQDDADDYEIDDYDEHYEEQNIERSVLLFNTWTDDQPGPKGVNGDYISGAIPDGIALDEEDMAQFQNSMEAQRLSQWEAQYGTNAEALSCNPRSDWSQVPIDVYSSDSTSQKGELRPSLMGSKNRRAAEDKFVCLVGPTPALREALQEQQKVWQFDMEEE